jgi:hypothetical protein
LADTAGGHKLLKNLLLQYLGFAVVSAGREYSFRVRSSEGAEREFTVMVGNAGFVSGGLKYQEGPDVCYRKLLHALAGEQPGSPALPRQQLSDSELSEYKSIGPNKALKRTEEQRAAARLRFRERLQLG